MSIHKKGPTLVVEIERGCLVAAYASRSIRLILIDWDQCFSENGESNEGTYEIAPVEVRSLSKLPTTLRKTLQRKGYLIQSVKKGARLN